MSLRLSGVLPPLPTIFDARTGAVDEAAIRGNIDRLLQVPLAGVLALGSNGEAALLREDEADRVVAAAREAVPAGRVLLVGTGRESTAATIDACRRAAARGADAVLVRAPSFFRSQMTPPVLTTHFAAVADASPAPVVLYNLPAVTGFSLTVPMIESLASHPNIIGIKETSNELDRLSQFVAGVASDFSVLTGWAPVFYPALCAGAAGGILAVANVCPDACLAIRDYTASGRHEEARTVQRQITRLAQMVSSQFGVAGLKTALDAAGYRGGLPRAPLQPVSADVQGEIATELARFQGWFQTSGHRPALAG